MLVRVWDLEDFYHYERFENAKFSNRIRVAPEQQQKMWCYVCVCETHGPTFAEWLEAELARYYAYKPYIYEFMKMTRERMCKWSMSFQSDSQKHEQIWK